MLNPYQDTPAFYDLTTEKNALCIDVPPEVCLFVWEMSERSPMIKSLQQSLNLPDFVLPTQTKWGYGGCITTTQHKSSKWVRWRIQLPRICIPPLDPKWDEAYAISATLQFIFIGLCLYDAEITNEQSQLLHVPFLLTKKAQNGGALTVQIAPALCHWLAEKLNPSAIKDIEQTIARAYNFMFPIKGYSSAMECRVLVNSPKWISINCPGNACGLDPENYSDSSLDEGYELLPHNVDSPLQQLSLLMAIAKINQLARQYYGKENEYGSGATTTISAT